MKTFSIFLLTTFFFIQNSFCQFRNQQEFFYDKFNWNVSYPGYFEKMNPLESEVYNSLEFEVPTQEIFLLGYDPLNYILSYSSEIPFELLYFPEDEIKEMGEEFYYSLTYNIPDSLKSTMKIDSTYSHEWISYLKFEKFEMHLVAPNKTELHATVYLRQFGDQELFISNIYTNERLGGTMNSIIERSNFKCANPDSIPKNVDIKVHIPEERRADYYDDYEYDYDTYINLAQPEEDIKHLIDPHEIVLKDTTALLVIDYPGSKEWYFDLSSKSEKGFTKIEIIETICQKYHQVFENPEWILESYDMNHIYFRRRYDGKIVIELGIDS